MDLPGSSFLYGMAAVSIAFVGFSSLVLIFIRPLSGGALTRYDTFFTMSFTQAGFFLTAGSLLPPVLALYDLPQQVVWRTSSGVAAVALALFIVALPIRRWAATRRRPPVYTLVLVGIQILAWADFVSCTFGFSVGRGSAPYATGILLVFFTQLIAYLLALGSLLRQPHSADSAPS